MAGSLNKTMLIGRLGVDPELRYTQSGQPVCNFRMATDESFVDRQGNKQDRTEWHNVVVWGRQAETTANYLSKGRLVYVEGSLQTRKWQDQNGNDRYTTEIKAHRVQFLDSAKDQQGQQTQQGQGQQRPQQGRPQGQSQGRPQQGQQTRGNGNGNGRQAPPRQQPPQQGGGYDDDLGPAFPSEASGMDDVPF